MTLQGFSYFLVNLISEYHFDMTFLTTTNYKMTYKVLILVLASVFGSGNVHSQNGEKISIGSKHFMQSDVLQEEREY